MRNRWLCALLVPTTVWLAWLQDPAPEERVRGMINKALANGQPSTNAGRAPNQKVRPSDSFVGVTLWEMKPTRKSDPPGARMLVHRREQTDEMTLVRRDRNQPLSVGARLRFSVESARSGYLYVLTREIYADGSAGETYLIFPAVQIAGGDKNRVGPGRVVELPAWTDQPPYFTLERSRPDHVAERITLLVTPERMPSLIASRDPLKIPASQAKEWEERWGTQVEEIETGAAGSVFRTAAESKAAQTGYLLQAADPAPQTLFRVDVAANLPLLVSFPLPLAK